MARVPRQYWASNLKTLTPEEEQSHLFSVRRIAAEVTSAKELCVDTTAKVVSFRNFVHSCRVDVYYITGTVCICFLHPVSGKTQQFHSDVSLLGFKELLQNPRTSLTAEHLTEDIFSPGEVLSEEEALQSHLADIERQAQRVNSHIEEFERAREFQAQQLAEKKLQVEQLAQKQAQEVADILAARRLQEAADAAVPPVQKDVEKQTEQRAFEPSLAPMPPNRRYKGGQWRGTRNLRGNEYEYNIDGGTFDPAESFPTLICVALSQGGGVFVFDDGVCVPGNLPPDLDRLIVQHDRSGVVYIAFGEEGQYYIRKRNGTYLYHSGPEFEREIAYPVHPAFVSFGKFGTFFIQFQDGKKSFSSDLKSQLPKNVFNNVCRRDIQHLALGRTQRPWFQNVAYCVVYQNGEVEYECDEGNDAVAVHLNEIKDRAYLTHVLIGESNNYYVSYRYPCDLFCKRK